MTIDSNLFIDIILNEEGVRTLRTDSSNGESFLVIAGKNGRRVIICTSDEFISKGTATNYLQQLGLESLIQFMHFS